MEGGGLAQDGLPLTPGPRSRRQGHRGLWPPSCCPCRRGSACAHCSDTRPRGHLLTWARVGRCLPAAGGGWGCESLVGSPGVGAVGALCWVWSGILAHSGALGPCPSTCKCKVALAAAAGVTTAALPLLPLCPGPQLAEHPQPCSWLQAIGSGRGRIIVLIAQGRPRRDCPGKEPRPHADDGRGGRPVSHAAHPAEGGQRGPRHPPLGRSVRCPCELCRACPGPQWPSCSGQGVVAGPAGTRVPGSRSESTYLQAASGQRRGESHVSRPGPAPRPPSSPPRDAVSLRKAPTQGGPDSSPLPSSLTERPLCARHLPGGGRRGTRRCLREGGYGDRSSRGRVWGLLNE